MLGRKPKILVEHIINGIEHKKKLEDYGNRVLVKKGKGVKGSPNIYARYDRFSIIMYRAGVWPFRKLKPKLRLYDDHVECEKQYTKKVDQSSPDVAEVFNAAVFKNAGSTLSTVKIPTALYIAFAILIFISILDLMLSSGKVRIV